MSNEILKKCINVKEHQYTKRQLEQHGELGEGTNSGSTHLLLEAQI